MKKVLLLISLLISFSFKLSAQHQADRWYFGINAGISFASGSPVAVPGALSTTEGTSSASDANGNLLFYTDGMSVWNRSSQTMPNGTGLMGNISSTVSGLCIPTPGNPDQYYIFTMDEAGSPNGFRYSIVDMTQQSGQGDVTTKNILIKTDVTEKMAAVKQSGADAYWLAVHEWGTDAFYVYNINSGGFQSTPVISHTGMIHTIDANEQNKYGQMKFNACGTKLALGIGYLDTVEVFDFDPITGIVSNPVTIPMGDHVYGVEFSSGGNNLYVTSYNTSADYSMLSQFDLTAGTNSAIIASELVVSLNNSGTSYYYALQLGPDARMYVCKSWSQFLGVVQDPDVVGTGCNYNDMGFDLDPSFSGATAALGLPSFIQSYFKGEITCIVPTALDENELNAAAVSLEANPSVDEFVLNNKTNADLKIFVYDNTGRMVERISSTENEIHVGKNLSAGIYFISTEYGKDKQVLKAVKL